MGIVPLSSITIEQASTLADLLYPPQDNQNLELNASAELKASIDSRLMKQYTASTNITSARYWVSLENSDKVVGFLGLTEVNEKYLLFDPVQDPGRKVAWFGYLAVDPSLEITSKGNVLLSLFRYCCNQAKSEGYSGIKLWTTCNPDYNSVNKFFKNHLEIVSKHNLSPFGEPYPVTVFQLKLQ